MVETIQANPPQDTPHLLVLGGGLSGLSLAREVLLKDRCRVTILEKADRVGGLAVSLQVGGLTSDLGPHRIYSTIPEMRDWFEEVAGDRLFVVRRMSRMYVRGQYINYPPATRELMRVFGVRDLSRFVSGYVRAKAGTVFNRTQPVNFGQAMERSFGRPLCEALVFPITEKTWKTRPDRISADVARARATMGGIARIAKRMLFPREKEGQESTLRTFHYLRGGIERLAERMAADIRKRGGEIRTEAEVKRVSTAKNRVTEVEYVDSRGDPQKVSADFVFSTIPVTELVEDLSADGVSTQSSLAKEALQAASGLRFLNTILVFAVLRRPSLSADHWLYFPEKTPSINRAYESKNFDSTLTPKDLTLLCIEGTALPGSREWAKKDADIAKEFVQAMAATRLFTSDEVVQTYVHRLPYAYPLYDLGYEKHLAEIWKYLSGIENLIPLGRQGLFQHNNMDHTIFTGIQAARCWRENSRQALCWYRDYVPGFQAFRIVD